MAADEKTKSPNSERQRWDQHLSKRLRPDLRGARRSDRVQPGLLLGTPIGNNAIVATLWCVAIALAGYLWARAAYNRDPIR